MGAVSEAKKKAPSPFSKLNPAVAAFEPSKKKGDNEDTTAGNAPKKARTSVTAVDTEDSEKTTPSAFGGFGASSSSSSFGSLTSTTTFGFAKPFQPTGENKTASLTSPPPATPSGSLLFGQGGTSAALPMPSPGGTPGNSFANAAKASSGTGAAFGFGSSGSNMGGFGSAGASSSFSTSSPFATFGASSSTTPSTSTTDEEKAAARTARFGAGIGSKKRSAPSNSEAVAGNDAAPPANKLPSGDGT